MYLAGVLLLNDFGIIPLPKWRVIASALFVFLANPLNVAILFAVQAKVYPDVSATERCWLCVYDGGFACWRRVCCGGCPDATHRDATRPHPCRLPAPAPQNLWMGILSAGIGIGRLIGPVMGTHLLQLFASDSDGECTAAAAVTHDCRMAVERVCFVFGAIQLLLLPGNLYLRKLLRDKAVEDA